MKTIACIVMCLTASAAFGADIIAQVPGPNGVRSFVLTATETTLHHVDWEAINGGGVYEVRGRLDQDSVILIETMWSIDDGIRIDKSSKTVVPTSKIPKEVTIGSMNITLVRAEDEKDNK